MKQKGGKRKKGSEVDDAAAKPKKVEVKKSPPQLTLRIAGTLYLRHYYESSECLTARQHKVAEVVCSPTLERMLIECADCLF